MKNQYYPNITTHIIFFSLLCYVLSLTVAEAYLLTDICQLYFI